MELLKVALGCSLKICDLCMFYVLSVSVIKHTFKVVHLLLISLSSKIQNCYLLVTIKKKLPTKKVDSFYRTVNSLRSGL